VAVLAVWSGANAPHLLTAGHAGAIPRATGVELDLSTLFAARSGAAAGATVNAASGLSAAESRVSRNSRTPAGSRAAADAPDPVRPAALTPPTAERSATKPAAPHWVRPSAGAESSCFCMRWGTMHEGIDLAGPLDSPIVAVGDGVVVEAGPAAGFGLWVVIRHANGDYSIYGHMYTYYVTVGEHVRAGQHIADIGANGQSTGPHLHFGVARGSVQGPYLDPVPWLAARGIEVGPYDPDA
jgi:murein DD-endopeptidase MepM/ murein hydrolase activator NlpD